MIDERNLYPDDDFSEQLFESYFGGKLNKNIFNRKLNEAEGDEENKPEENKEQAAPEEGNDEQNKSEEDKAKDSAFNKVAKTPKSEEELKEILNKCGIEEIGPTINTLLKNDYAKVMGLLRKISGEKADNVIKVEEGQTADINSLIPTQNVIGVDGSLKFILEKGPSDSLFADPAVVIYKVKGEDGKESSEEKPPLIYNNKYIVDGHHRWSQIYMVNPNGQMKVINLSGPEMNAEDILKLTQVAIASTHGKVPSSKAEGINLFTADEESVRDYIKNNCSDTCIAGMKKHFGDEITDADKVADVIVPNAMALKEKNQPAPGAPDRKYMPQTDGEVVKQMEQGQETLKAESLRRSIRKKPLREWSDDIDGWEGWNDNDSSSSSSRSSGFGTKYPDDCNWTRDGEYIPNRNYWWYNKAQNEALEDEEIEEACSKKKPKKGPKKDSIWDKLKKKNPELNDLDESMDDDIDEEFLREFNDDLEGPGNGYDWDFRGWINSENSKGEYGWNSEEEKRERRQKEWERLNRRGY